MISSTIVFVYDYFYPDYTAGGPITSLGNLYELMRDEASIRVITSAYQFEPRKPLKNIVADQWTTWNNLPVWYATDDDSIKKAVKGLEEGAATTFYLNGIFSRSYFLLPLRLAKKRGNRIVISPRGMLQAGALQKGRLKKLLYLFVIRRLHLLNKVTWHSTDLRESQDIVRMLGYKPRQMMVTNVPVVRSFTKPTLSKRKGELRLVYYSLIAEKKNLLFLLTTLNDPALEQVQLDIYGPIKDKGYWKDCENEMAQRKGITYKGDVKPEDSAEVLSRYHALVLPTHGENFGHAIVEMLAVSRPVVISDKTPWKDVAAQGAGYSVILNEDLWKAVLIKMLDWEETDFHTACTAAYAYYHHKFDFDKMKKEYIRLFSPFTKA